MSDKTTLKTFFEDDDVPTGAQFADLIDSQVNQEETSDQSVGGNLGIAGQAKGGDNSGAFSATKTFDMNDGNMQKMILTGNVTSLALSNKVNGSAYYIKLEQGGAGGYSVSGIGASFGDVTDNSVDSADWPTTLGSKLLITVLVDSDGDTEYSIETLTV